VGPRCSLWAAAAPGRLRPRSRARRPAPPPSFYDGPLLVLPGGDLLLLALGGLAGRDLHAPADSVQQQVHPGQGVLDAEPAPHDLGAPCQNPAQVAPADDGRAGIQRHLEHTQLTRIELAAGTPGPLGDQGLPTARSQRPPPAVRRHPGHPEPPGHLPVTGPASIRSAAANRTRYAESDMTTNGYMLDGRTVEHLAGLGVRAYQISLDGRTSTTTRPACAPTARGRSSKSGTTCCRSARAPPMAAGLGVPRPGAQRMPLLSLHP
jgi:hypothetical protein